MTNTHASAQSTGTRTMICCRDLRLPTSPRRASRRKSQPVTRITRPAGVSLRSAMARTPRQRRLPRNRSTGWRLLCARK
jgi:hypothetical protein